MNAADSPLDQCALIVVAAGSGTRFGGRKQLAMLGGKPLLTRTLEAFEGMDFGARVLVLPADLASGPGWEELRASAAVYAAFRPVPGGRTRAESTGNGMAALPDSIAFAAIHDGARPFPPPGVIQQALARLAASPELAGVATGAPVTDTIKRVRPHEGGEVESTIPRDSLLRAETPQVVRVRTFQEVLGRADLSSITDDLHVLEAAGFSVALIPHTGHNPKVTHPGDIELLEAWLRVNTPEGNPPSPPCPFSIGFGYDVHRFAEGRRLVLGGVEIPSDVGLLGHSDADVLLHAVCDAILGGAGLADIGHHFPNSDSKWKDADSRMLLRESVRLAGEAGWVPANLDVALVAEKPKIAPHVDAMRQAVAADTGLPPGRIGIKATTNEGMGFIGRGEGIAAMATALLWRAQPSV